ncbi:hypothetical protein CBR_g71 [Chara braunii]|uniref:Uncharacterized protein n=1 Tax=Chara braunii TaxID=69332 RepID=A0A388JLH7_CHABU|nr:hypothetical protein CBR_g71 [Chara braunii]|eukprot:GBG58670.1 hypothetical protein CBR_g71 [Chara braunii]
MVYNPYDLEIVNHNEIDMSNFYTMSAAGVTHFAEASAEFTPLEQWEREYHLYNLISSLKTFRQYKMWKGFAMWKRFVRKKKTRHCCIMLGKHLFFLNSIFQRALLHIREEDIHSLDHAILDYKQTIGHLTSRIQQLEKRSTATPDASSSNFGDRSNILEIDVGTLKTGVQRQQATTQQLEQQICAAAAGPTTSPRESIPKFDGQPIFCDATKAEPIPWFRQFNLKLEIHKTRDASRHTYLYSRSGAQKAMTEREKMDFARGQGGMTTPQTGQTTSQSGTAPSTGEAKSRSLGQKAMDFLMEKTQVKAEIKITKVVKGEGGKEEEVEVWEYPEENIQSLNELYEKHAGVLFKFSGRSRELSLNEKRRKEGGTEGGSFSTKRKGESRGEEESNAQEGESHQGKRRQKTQPGEGATTGEEEGESRTSMDSSETSGKESEAESGPHNSTSKGTRAGEDGTGIADKSEEDLTGKDHPEGSSQQEEDGGRSQGAQGHVTMEDEERVRERARRRGMQNAENMTVEQILQAEEDQRESSPDTESESASEEEEEEEEVEQEDSDVEEWTRERWVKEVEQLEWGRTIECEIRLAHYKHLRNLQQATQAGEDITPENRFELLRREGEVNEFYASQYARKSRTVRNEILLQQEEYERIFQWPKSYHSKERKRDGKKRKAQTIEEQSSLVGGRNDPMEGAAMEEEQGKGEREEEEVQDLRRQAAILVVQVNLLKDENRELEDDTVNVQKIATGKWKEVEAAARLEPKNGRRRRVVLPCRWNAGYSDWEVAISQSLQLLTTPTDECSGSDLQKLIGGELPSRAFILREGGVEPMAVGEEGEERTMTDFGPLLLQMGTDSELREDLIWMPWRVVETIPYGLLGGELGAEWVARCTAVATKVEAFAWNPDFIERGLCYMLTELRLHEIQKGVLFPLEDFVNAQEKKKLQMMETLSETRPDAATKNFKMPQFTISKFDDYNKTEALTWWQGFLTEASCRTVPAEDMLKALYLQLIGGAQAWMNHLAATKKCTIAELHTHITWKEFEQLWITRFMVRNVVKVAMNEVYTCSQGNMPTRDWTIKWQKIVTTPGFDLSFTNQRSEFFSRSCAGLRSALGNEYDYTSFQAILDHPNLVIQTDDKAANEKQSQPHYVAKPAYQRPAHNNAVISEETVDLHAAAASSSDGGIVAALPPKRPKRVRKNKATQETTSTGTGQQPWTA